MKILIAEDDPSSRLLLKTTLEMWEYEVTATENGQEAWDSLQGDRVPSIAILDWMMPKLDGVELCRKIRESEDSRLQSMYIVILTAKANRESLVQGLDGGADDYMTKPFDRQELRARVSVGERVVQLQADLASRIVELEEALSKVKLLQGLIPICSYCKKIRDDENYWQQVESYIGEHSEARFSHSVCPPCYTEHIEPQIERLKNQMDREATQSADKSTT